MKRVFFSIFMMGIVVFSYPKPPIHLETRENVKQFYMTWLKLHQIKPSKNTMFSSEINDHLMESLKRKTFWNHQNLDDKISISQFVFQGGATDLSIFGIGVRLQFTF